MSWLKTSDTAATHPRVLALRNAPGAKEHTVNEVFGFVSRLAVYSAGQLTDYRIDIGAAEMLGGRRTRTLLRQAVAVGLMVEQGDGSDRYWMVVEDSDGLFHIRRQDEIEFERQRKRDASKHRVDRSGASARR